MFIYQTKINGKDGLVALSETQDKGNQVPVYGEEVLTVAEVDGVLVPSQRVISESGESEVSITLDKDTLALTVGTDGELKATTVPSGATITWESDDDTIATVSNGTVSPVAAGTCTITASITVDGVTKSAECDVTVSA